MQAQQSTKAFPAFLLSKFSPMHAPIAVGAAAAGGYFFFFAAAVFAARACCFCLSALLWSACFCEDFFWLDFGDLSPMVLFFSAG